VDELDDQRGCCPRHNKSATEVRRGKVGPQCDIGDEGGGQNYSECMEEA